jgi:hypothetical protein
VRAFIDKAKGNACKDCPRGVIWPSYVLHFDHVRGRKDFNLAAARWRTISLARIKAEIAKCEVVCANCHAIRTPRATSCSRVAVRLF